jgi:hypothetical protein
MSNTEKFHQIAALMIEGFSIEAIAKKLSIGSASIYRWKKTEDFQKIYQSLSHPIISDIREDIHEHFSRADRLHRLSLELCERIITDDSESSRNRLAAAALATKLAPKPIALPPRSKSIDRTERIDHLREISAASIDHAAAIGDSTALRAAIDLDAKLSGAYFDLVDHLKAALDAGYEIHRPD